jgi:hypothetical protein
MSDPRAPKDWKKAKGKKGISPEGPEAMAALDAIRAGNYITVACISAGISWDTYRRWMKIGKLALEGDDAEHAPHARFYLATRKAMADAEVGLLRRIEVAGQIDWQPNAWLLERRHNKRWGKRIETKSEIAMKSIELPHNIDLLGPEEARVYLRALAKMAETDDVRAQFEAAAEALEGASS